MDDVIIYSGLSIEPLLLQTNDALTSAKIICNSQNICSYRLDEFIDKNYYMLYSSGPGETYNAVGWNILGLDHDPIYGNICIISKSDNGDILPLDGKKAEDVMHWINDECCMWELDPNKKLDPFENKIWYLGVSITADKIEVAIIDQYGIILYYGPLDEDDIIRWILRTKGFVVSYQSDEIKKILVNYNDVETEKIINEKLISCADRFAIVYGNYDDDKHRYRKQSLDVAADFYEIKRTGVIRDTLSNVFICKEIWEIMNRSYDDR